MRAILLAALVVAACSSGKSSGKAPARSLAEVKAAWAKAGLDPSALAEVASEKLKLGDGRCESGALDGLETTVCEYDDEKAARKAESAGLALVGETTGTSLAEGKVLLVVADRKNTDPNGRKLNKIAQTFRHAR